jgi:hypothetical protein
MKMKDGGACMPKRRQQCVFHGFCGSKPTAWWQRALARTARRHRETTPAWIVDDPAL